MPTDSLPLSSEHVLLIRLDEKMTIWLGLFKEHKDAMEKDFDQVWKAIDDLRAKQGETSDKQLASDSKQAGMGWLMKVLLGTPGLAALIAVLADKKP